MKRSCGHSGFERSPTDDAILVGPRHAVAILLYTFERLTIGCFRTIPATQWIATVFQPPIHPAQTRLL